LVVFEKYKGQEICSAELLGLNLVYYFVLALARRVLLKRFRIHTGGGPQGSHCSYFIQNLPGDQVELRYAVASNIKSMSIVGDSEALFLYCPILSRGCKEVLALRDAANGMPYCRHV
jgi:hypothetical protein